MTSASMQRKGAALVLGGVVVVALSRTKSFGIEELPVTLGIIYLVAAALAGRSSPLWASAVVYTIFGAGVQLSKHHVLDSRIDPTTIEILALGLAVGVGALLQRQHFGVDTMGLGIAAALIGAILLIGALGGSKVYDPLYYGILLALYGLYELRPRSSARR